MLFTNPSPLLASGTREMVSAWILNAVLVMSHNDTCLKAAVAEGRWTITQTWWCFLRVYWTQYPLVRKFFLCGFRVPYRIRLTHTVPYRVRLTHAVPYRIRVLHTVFGSGWRLTHSFVFTLSMGLGSCRLYLALNEIVLGIRRLFFSIKCSKPSGDSAESQ